MADARLDLYDPRIGGLALKLDAIAPDSLDAEAHRSNCFTVLWIQAGRGMFSAAPARFPYEAPCLLFAVPYQVHQLIPESSVQGLGIQFHANFFCIETYHEEVGCNGVLFNDVYGAPVVGLGPSETDEFAALFGAMERELTERGLAHNESLVSYLKILLIRATRLKLDQQRVSWQPSLKLPPMLDELRMLIEARYRQLHRPGDYARLLHITPKALSRLVKTHHRKTLTELIRDRVMREARWELLHTTKSVKQVAGELGFDDVFHFSRLFKRASGCSPTFYRDYETAIRGGRNLSMPSRDPSIPGPAAATQNEDVRAQQP